MEFVEQKESSVRP